ncbi:Clr5 domain-containing protein [Cercophora samala]|uniref:Clr5 domain-containing protein n=1 Tax=Cercophora samala TaxID=330535 RepID=A0AA40DDQ8_9PEZI|nr:Clr5 domain-containing protein [Cercophora samala]
MPPSGHPIDWEAHRKIFEDLYMVQDKPLADVMKIMREDLGVDATKKMYKKRIKAWGLFKNINGDEMMAMLRIQEHRRRQGRRTQFYLRGKPVPDSKLRRFSNRHGVVLDDEDISGDVQAALREITFSTPEPEEHRGSIVSRHGSLHHSSPVISDADLTSLDCFVGSPNTATCQVLPDQCPDRSWDVAVSSPTGCAAQGAIQLVSSHSLADTTSIRPTTHQVYAWLEDADHSRFDGDCHFPPLPGGPDIGHDMINSPTDQHFPYDQHLEIQQPADRSPNSSLENPALCFSQVPEFVCDHSSFQNAAITNDATFTRHYLSEGVNAHFTVRDGAADLHHGFSQHHYDTPTTYVEHDSINFGGWSGVDFTWPS